MSKTQLWNRMSRTSSSMPSSRPHQACRQPINQKQVTWGTIEWMHIAAHNLSMPYLLWQVYFHLIAIFPITMRFLLYKLKLKLMSHEAILYKLFIFSCCKGYFHLSCRTENASLQRIIREQYSCRNVDFHVVLTTQLLGYTCSACVCIPNWFDASSESLYATHCEVLLNFH